MANPQENGYIFKDSRGENMGEKPISSVNEIIPNIKNPEKIATFDSFHDIRGEDLPVDRNSQSTAYSCDLYHKVTAAMERKGDKDYDQLRDFLGKLKGQTIVDLGAGPSPYGYRALQVAEIKGYVLVEPFNAESLKFSIENNIDSEISGSKKVPVSIVQEDMLTFLRRLPNNSVSVLCSGIDRAIIHYEEEMEEIGAEILRVLHPDGVFINYYSEISLPDKDGELNNYGIDIRGRRFLNVTSKK